MGATAYRAPDWDQAVAALRRTQHPHAGWQLDSPAWPLLAMAYWQLGRPDEARHALEDTRAYLELVRRAADAGRPGGPGTQDIFWMYTRVFHREAKLLIDGPEALAAEN